MGVAPILGKKYAKVCKSTTEDNNGNDETKLVFGVERNRFDYCVLTRGTHHIFASVLQLIISISASALLHGADTNIVDCMCCNDLGIVVGECSKSTFISLP